MRKSILAALFALIGVTAHAGQATFDFSSDPTSSLQIGGNNTQPWVESGGNPGGFLAITYPVGGQYTGFVFPDIDSGKIITAFRFEADLRVGNSTGDRAADGFSISIARANDPVLGDIGNAGNFAGSIPEGGSTTGIAISFDTWAGNTYADGGDIEGILVRVDNKTVLRHSVPTRHGACADATSLQTGPRDADYWANGGEPMDPASWAGLCWQPLVVNLDESAKLTVIWKGVTILDGFQTDFFPSAGRLVLGGRTGGANEHTHIDNIKLSTTASGSDTTPPTAPGNAKVALSGARFVKLTWGAATDDSGRVGYEVEKDGATPPLLVNALEWTDTGLLPESSHSYRLRAIDVSGNASAWQTFTTKTVKEVDGVGFLLGQIYDNIPNTDVASLVFADAFFEKNPTRGVYVNGLDFDGYGENYGILITGVLTAPKTGQYDFFVRSDDASQFFLNEAGPAIPNPEFDLYIAEETGCCNAFQEVGAPQTTQVPISLTAGKQYGFAFVVKEGGGGDWGQVAMREVGDPTPADQLQPIRGAILTGKADAVGAELAITAQPTNVSATANEPANFSVTATHSSPYGAGVFYQWYRNGALIPGASATTYNIPLTSLADNGAKFKVTVGTLGKAVTSSEVTLTVANDTRPPTLVKATPADSWNSVTIEFSEPVTAASATTAGNYSLSGGVTVSSATQVNPTTVLLATSKQAEATQYTLTVRNLADNAGNTIAATGITQSITSASRNIAIGLNFGADQPNDAGTFALGATDRAGVPGLVQSNWNNLAGAAGTGAALTDANGVATGLSIEWTSNNTWASTGIGETNGDNFAVGTPDHQLMAGYIDTGDPTKSTVTITGIPANLTETGYDLYVYALGGVASGRSGSYRVVNAADGAPLTEYVRATSATSPTEYSIVVPSTDPTVYAPGTHLVFKGLKASNIILEATTEAGFGAGSPARAPVNAVQLVPTGAGAGGSVDLVKGLTAYWSFDGNLNEPVGKFNGTARGTAPIAYGAGKAGQALVLDGSNFVEITGGDHNNLQFPGGSMSIGGWFKVGAFDKDWQALISKGEGSNYRVARRGGSNSIAYAGGVGEGADNAPNVNDGNWHHFVAVSDATGAAFGTAIYIDGKIYGVNATKPVLAAGTKNLFIGENPDALNRRWVGSIDDIAIWNRVLTPAEVAALYNGGTGLAVGSVPGVPAGGGGTGGGIGIARTATSLTLTYQGTLQSSDSILGPFTDVPGAASPATIPFSGSGKFYRTRQ
jgi:hypothetical protein